MRVVTQGLLPTDRVIVNGLQKARPGLVVSPMEDGAKIVQAQTQTEARDQAQ